MALCSSHQHIQQSTNRRWDPGADTTHTACDPRGPLPARPPLWRTSCCARIGCRCPSTMTSSPATQTFLPRRDFVLSVKDTGGSDDEVVDVATARADRGRVQHAVRAAQLGQPLGHEHPTGGASAPAPVLTAGDQGHRNDCARHSVYSSSARTVTACPGLLAARAMNGSTLRCSTPPHPSLNPHCEGPPPPTRRERFRIVRSADRTSSCSKPRSAVWCASRP